MLSFSLNYAKKTLLQAKGNMVVYDINMKQVSAFIIMQHEFQIENYWIGHSDNAEVQQL